MTSDRKKRKLRNMRLTEKFHFAHLGIWIVISIGLVALVNFLLYIVIVQQLDLIMDSGGGGGLGEVGRMRLAFGLILEGFVFAVALVVLAKSTSHRIAGPHLRTIRTCREIQNGNRGLRLKFREYDLLEDVADAFNSMMDSLCPDRSRKSEE